MTMLPPQRGFSIDAWQYVEIPAAKGYGFTSEVTIVVRDPDGAEVQSGILLRKREEGLSNGLMIPPSPVERTITITARWLRPGLGMDRWVPYTERGMRFEYYNSTSGAGYALDLADFWDGDKWHNLNVVFIVGAATIPPP